MLTFDNVSTCYGKIQALHGVSLEVREGEIVTLIGANGAGKSTLLMTLCGTPRASAGSIRYRGEELVGQDTAAIMRKGIAVVPEGRRIFARLTVEENLAMGGFFASREEVEARLERVGLADCANRLAGTLAYGQQRRLEIARCMMTRPRLLMLDEPAAGLNPRETEDLKALIGLLRDEHGLGVLLIEHDMPLVMGISDRIVVINQGRPLAEGTPAQIRCHPEVIKAYLGEA